MQKKTIQKLDFQANGVRDVVSITGTFRPLFTPWILIQIRIWFRIEAEADPGSGSALQPMQIRIIVLDGWFVIYTCHTHAMY